MTDTAPTPTAPLLPPLPAAFDLEHPLGFTDEHGSSWKLASTPFPSADTLVELSCSSDRVLIDADSFRVSGRCLLRTDGQAHPPQLEFIAPTHERPHGDPSQRVRNQAKKRLEAALASPQAAALVENALLYTTLPVDARMRIDDLTRIALATREESSRSSLGKRSGSRPADTRTGSERSCPPRSPRSARTHRASGSGEPRSRRS